jgi:hypothetical protein
MITNLKNQQLDKRKFYETPDEDLTFTLLYFTIKIRQSTVCFKHVLGIIRNQMKHKTFKDVLKIIFGLGKTLIFLLEI